jgi:hypothetical protein
MTRKPKYFPDILWASEKYDQRCYGKLFLNTIQINRLHPKIPNLPQIINYLRLHTKSAILITTTSIQVLKYKNQWDLQGNTSRYF